MDSKKIAIVIAAYNASKTISKTLAACLAQEAPDVNVTVVDDGSTDDSKDSISRFPGIKYIYQQRQGPATARNTGWKSTKAAIICFTDADCIPEKEWVKKLASRFDSDRIGAVGGSYDIADERSLLAVCIYQEILQRHLRMPKETKVLGSYNLAARREVLEEVGGFNEEYRTASGEDNDLSYKIIKKGYTLLFDKDIKVSHFHPESLPRYLQHQFWHGYWRMKLYYDHPRMVMGDDYSNISDYLQPLIGIIIIAIIPFRFIFDIDLIFISLLFAEFVLQLPISLAIVGRTKEAKYLMLIPITFVRAFARGLGMAIGLWKGVFYKRISRKANIFKK